MSYQIRPDDNGMQGIMEYGDKPPIRIKLVIGPEPTPRRTNPSPAVTSEYDTRTSARGARTQQFTKSGIAMEPHAMEGMEMMDTHMYGTSTASKKNSRGTASKDVRSQMHGVNMGGMGAPVTPGRPGMGRGTVMNPGMPGMVGTPGVPSTPVSGAYGRGNGMLPPNMVGSPAPYMQNPGSPYVHSGHIPMGIPGPANTPQMPRNVRSTPIEPPMTPGPMANGGAFFPDDSQGLNNADELGSNLGSDDEEGDDKSKKNKRGKPKNRGNANRKKEEDDIFGDEDPQTAGYNASIAIWKTVEAYFADFVDEDFRLVAVDAKDDAFRVPALGKKAQLSQHSLAHSASGSHLLQQSQSEMDIAPKLDAGSLFGGPNGPSLVTRLISSLIEETSMPSFSNYLSARPPVIDIPLSSSEQDPMFGIVSQQEAEFIENRIQKELLALGLFGDFDAPADSANGTANGSSSFKDTRSSTGAAKEAAAEKDVDDDDEVLSELKRMQTKLRARLESNNQIKQLLRQQMDAANGERKKAKEEREALAKLDQSYVQSHKAIIKKRKKPTAKQAAAASSKAGTSKAEGSGSGTSGQ